MKRTNFISMIVTFLTIMAGMVFPQSEQYLYKPYKGSAINLYPYKGRNIALLVPLPNLNIKTLKKIITTFDKVYDYYQQTTGCEPTLYLSYKGVGTIAVVPETCGAGCGFMGQTGIELTNSTFDTLYNGVRDRNEYDQATFYEFGRNFWFYENKIEYKKTDASEGSITTGYAVFMRFMALEAVGVTPGPFNGTKFSTFKSKVKGLINLYLKNKSLNWENTLKIGHAPDNSMNLGATDLFASFLFKLRELYGNKFIQKLWKEVRKRPDAQTTQDAVDNFILAASSAANKNLTDLFVNTWRWPISKPARDEAMRICRPILPKTPSISTRDHVDFRSIGPIQIGMTFEQLQSSFKAEIILEEEYSEGCTYAVPKDDLLGIRFMIFSGKVVRFDIDKPGLRTVSGAQVGDSEKQVIALYKGRLTITKHTYIIDGGHYLTLRSQDGQWGLVFETDGKRVISYRIGHLPETEWIEGCL